jgi:hypothetical protein
MDLFCSWTDNRDHLCAHLAGDYSLDGFKRVIDEVRVETERRGCEKVLVDMTALALEDLPILDRYEMGRYAAEVWGYRVKVAVTARADLVNNFAETVAVNRGARVAVFADEGRAMAWLLSDAARPPGSSERLLMS